MKNQILSVFSIKTLIATFTALATAASLSTAHGSIVLAGYDFDTGANVGTRAPTVTATNISASDFGVGAGLIDVLATQAGSGANDAEGNPFGTANNRNFGGKKDEFGFSTGNLAAAITANDYMTFSVTPENGESFDLESFTFLGYRGSNGTRAAQNWSLFSSVGGFATSTDNIGTGTNASGWNNQIVTLGDEFNNVSTTTEFRLYIYGTSGGPTNSQTIFDKVIVNGVAIAVPEPSTLALLGAGLGLLAATGRRRKYSV